MYNCRSSIGPPVETGDEVRALSDLQHAERERTSKASASLFSHFSR